MELTQAVVKFFQENGIAGAILFFVAWFLVGKLWPWYTTVYLPSSLTRQDTRDKVMSELRDAIHDLKALTQQLVTELQQHDASTRDLVIALGSNQQAILDLLHDEGIVKT